METENNQTDLSSSPNGQNKSSWQGTVVVLIIMVATIFIMFRPDKMYKRRKPSPPPPPDRQHYASGLRLLGEKKYDDAINEFTKVIEMKPDDFQAYYARGWAYDKQNKHLKAIADFSNSIELNPNYVENFVARGYAYESVNNLLQAEKDYQQAFKMDSGHTRATLGLAVVDLYKGKYEDALNLFNRIIEKEPDNGDFYCQRAVGNWLAGRPDDALTDCNRAIELKHFCHINYANRGRVLFYQNKFAEAEANFEKAAKIKPGNPYIQIWLYITRIKSGKNGVAALKAFADKYVKNDKWINPVVKMFLKELTPEQCLADAENSDPGTSKDQKCEAYFYIGMFYKLNKQPAKAREFFQKCRETNVMDFMEFAAAKVELDR